MSKRSGVGFTLIELLVVIAIIAILSTVGLTIYTDAQKSARVAKRTEDLRSIKNALEVYYSVNKNYPSTLTSGSPEFKSICTGTDSDKVIEGFVPKYMNSLPQDPSYDDTANTGCYYYASNGADYKFYIDPPNTDMSHGDFQSQPALIDPARDGSTADNCRVDTPSGGTVTAWAIWSSCDPDPAKCAESSCSW